MNNSTATRERGRPSTTTTARHFGEPDLTSPPLFNQRLKCYIDCGSYITYNHKQNQGYGQLIATVVGGEAVVNEYSEYETFMEEHDEIHDVPLKNPYIEVRELIQTKSIIYISHDEVRNIIFTFRKDDIVDGFFPCEGVECAFTIRFRFVNEENLTLIPSDQCLPFPCLYELYHLTMSYSRRIFNSLQLIRSTITQIMCRKGKNLGLSFISASKTITVSKESWLFLVEYFKTKNMDVYGPFEKKKRELQVRNGIELNSVRLLGAEYMMQFATRAHFQAFDALFGKYSRIGFAEPNPTVGATSSAELNHFIFHMGSDLFSNAYEFKRRVTKNAQLGLDLQYDNVKLVLGITLRYKKERAEDNATIADNIRRRKDRNSENSSSRTQDPVQARSYSLRAHDFGSTIKAGAVFNYNGCTYKVLDNFDSSQSVGHCVVTSASMDTQIIDSTHSFEYGLIHDQICAMIQSLFS